MNITQAIKMSAKSIFSNKARSALTMLGIIIGLAAVIVLVSYAQGQNMAMQRYYESMGTNKISVSAYDWTGGTDISQSLYDYCLNLSDQVVGFSPTGTVNSAPPIKFGSKTLAQDTNGGGAIIMGGGMAVSGDRGSNYPTLYLGNNQFGQCNDYTIAKGRDLSYLDSKLYRNVVVLGARTASYLFDQVDPVGKEVHIGGQPFLVIGVYQAKDPDSDYSMDNMAVVPETATRILRSQEKITSFTAKAKNRAAVKQAITLLSGYLEGQVGKDNCSVQSDEQFIDDAKQQNATMSLVLGGIAGISLLVGGIGIMNIMLVTVSERTREIGIRKAIGAPRSSILLQFLVESAMVCGLGGVLGILLGLVGTLIAGKLILKLLLFPDPVLATGAFLFSVVLGIAFGMYPAIMASGLTPVAALRTD